MLSKDVMDAQVATELPAREVMSSWLNINIAMPIQISNNINVQLCGVGYGNVATCSNQQVNLSTIWIRF